MFLERRCSYEILPLRATGALTNSNPHSTGPLNLAATESCPAAGPIVFITKVRGNSRSARSPGDAQTPESPNIKGVPKFPEIRTEDRKPETEQAMAFSPHAGRQVLLQAMTLQQMLILKTDYTSKLDSLIEPDKRPYYRDHNFRILKAASSVRFKNSKTLYAFDFIV